LIHYANLLNLPGADKVAEAYRTDPATDFYQIVANAASISRKEAKTCIAEGQLVLTNKGLVPIEQIKACHMLWDGLEWVNHDGVVYMGEKEVISYGNLTATPDHDVWTVQSGKIPFGLAASRLDALVSTGNAEQAVQYVDNYQQGNTTPWQASICKSAVQMWRRGLETFGQPQKWKNEDVPTLYYAGTTCSKGESFGYLSLCSVITGPSGGDISTMQQQKQRWMERLRRAWYTLRIQQHKRTGGIFNHLASGKRVEGIYHRQDQQRGKLCCWKYTESDVSGKHQQSSQHGIYSIQKEKGLFNCGLAFIEKGLSKFFIWKNLDTNPSATGYDSRGSVGVQQKQIKKVYDIVNAGKRHRFTVSGVLVANCSLGMMYGMGKNKLAGQLDMPVDEASELIATFHQKVPFLRGTVDADMRRIEHPASGGSIRTLLGRKCRFPLWEPTAWGINKALPYEQAMVEYGPRIKRAMTYKGLNKLIQGSAADQTKAAMVALDKAGFRVLLQVHDELAVSVSSREEAEEAARIMCNAVELEVPSRVDVELGPSWGEAK
jgi:hypothetical protein